MAFTETQNSDGSTEFINTQTGLTAMKYRPEQGADDGIVDFVRLFDDFLGDAVDARWTPVVGIDAQAVTPTITQTNNGLVRLTSGNAGDTMANDGSQLNSGLNWIPANGGLYGAFRVKPVSGVATVCYNVGFTDTAALEMPITLSGTTLTTNASDAAVFVFDTAADNDYWHAQGVKGNTDTALTNTAVAPVADTYTLLEIYIDTSGTATFKIDGTLKATIANAVTPSVALTPTVAVTARTTSERSIDIDYIEVVQKRL